jgi:preprotein translocase subunit SecE
VRRILDYLSEVRAELSKVTWPKRDEIIKLTIVVLLISAIVGLYVGALDFVFTKLLEITVSK